MSWKRRLHGPPAGPLMPISSDLSIRSAPPGEHTVTKATGLISRVRAAADGSFLRSWVVRVADDGRRRRFGSGPVPHRRPRPSPEKGHGRPSRRHRGGSDPSVTAKRRQRLSEGRRGTLTLGKAIDHYLPKPLLSKNAKSDEIRERALRIHFAVFHPEDIVILLRPTSPASCAPSKPNREPAYSSIRRGLRLRRGAPEAAGRHYPNPRRAASGSVGVEEQSGNAARAAPLRPDGSSCLKVVAEVTSWTVRRRAAVHHCDRRARGNSMSGKMVGHRSRRADMDRSVIDLSTGNIARTVHRPAQRPCDRGNGQAFVVVLRLFQFVEFPDHWPGTSFI